MGKRIVVTGGSGFLGNHVVKALNNHGYYNDSAPMVIRSADWDLRRREVVRRMYMACGPDIVIHLAAVCGGIGANQKEPGRFFYENLIMGLEMIDQARENKTEKFVQVGTVCAYPKFTPVPFKESDLWNGYPEETNAPYGIAKKALLVQCQAYRQQYGLNAIYLLPVNLYGPGDNFDLESSHVIPALIRKFIEAKERGDSEVVIWGTGNASREFLYVEDCAEAIVSAMEKYDGAEPINIGSGCEVTIAELVDIIKWMVGYEGQVVFDTTKPDGQPRRCLETSKAKAAFEFTASTTLAEGIRKTIDWYLANTNRNL